MNRTGKRVPLRVAVQVRVATHVAQGLRHMRDCGYAHLDIKPDNILILHGAAGGFEVKIADLGLALPINLANGRVLDPTWMWYASLSSPLQLTPQNLHGTSHWRRNRAWHWPETVLASSVLLVKHVRAGGLYWVCAESLILWRPVAVHNASDLCAALQETAALDGALCGFSPAFVRLADALLSLTCDALPIRRGTVGYLHPGSLMARHEGGVQDDLYAFGAVLWEMLTGKSPADELLRQVADVNKRTREGLRVETQRQLGSTNPDHIAMMAHARGWVGLQESVSLHLCCAALLKRSFFCWLGERSDGCGMHANN